MSTILVIGLVLPATAQAACTISITLPANTAVQSSSALKDAWDENCFSATQAGFAGPLVPGYAPANGSVDFAGRQYTTQFRYTPAVNFVGTDSFRLQGDQMSGQGAGIVIVNVTVTARAPVTADASAIVAYNSSGNAMPLNFSGVAPTSVQVVGQAAHGAATASGTSVLYTPTPGYAGPDSFTYRASNSGGASNVSTLSITVTTPPPPVAGAYTAPVVAYDAAQATFSLAGQATNGPTAYAVGSATTANGGQVSIASSGLATYRPPTGFRGDDTFTYTASNPGGTSSPATVTVPVGNPTLSATVVGSGAKAGVALSGYAVAGSGGRAPYACQTSVVSGALPAGVALNADCSLTGTPTQGGAFTFAVQVADSSFGTGAFSQAVPGLGFSVQQPAPTVSISTPVNGSTSASHDVTVSGSATNATSVTVTFQGVSYGPNPVSGGFWSQDLPRALANGAYTVSAVATNGQETSGAATSTFMVAGPTLSAISPSSGAAAGGTSVTVSGANFVAGSTSVTIGGATITAANVTVASATSLTFTTPAHAAGNVAVTVTTPSGTSGSAPGGFTYVSANPPVVTSIGPSRGFYSESTILYVLIYGSNIRDATGVTFGGVSSNLVAWTDVGQFLMAMVPAGTGTVDVQVITPNGTSATNGSSKFTYYGPPVITSVDVHPEYSGVEIHGSNLFSISSVVFDNGEAAFIAERNTDDSSTGTSVRASWSLVNAPSGTVNVTVYAAGGAAIGTGYALSMPTLTAIGPSSGSTAGGTPVTLTGTNFVAGSTSVMIGATTIPAASVTVNSATSLTFATPANAAGNVGVTVRTPNGTSGVAPGGFTYGVAPPSPPVASPVSATVAYGSSNNTVTLSLAGETATGVAVAVQATHGVAAASGTTITYTPTAGYGGPDSFTYTATGAGGVSTPAAVTITVTPPTIAVDATVLPTGRTGVTYTQTRTASGGTGPYAYAVSTGALPAGLQINASTGEISGTPTAVGTSTFTVRARDASTGTGPYEGLQPHTIVITAVAAPPVAGPASATVPYGSSNNPITLNLTGGATTATTIGTQAAHGTATATGTTITYTPNAGYSGPDSFTYTATNLDGTSAPATVTITVGAPPQTVTAPIAGPVSATVVGNSGPVPIPLDLTGGAAVSVATPTLPSHGSVTVSGLEIRYAPNAGYSGTDSFTYTATNIGGTSAAATVSLTISAANFTLSGIESSGRVGVAYSQAVTADSGVSPYVFILTGASPAGLSFTGGVLSGTPSEAGTFTFTIQATDARGAVGSGTYVLVIEPPALATPIAGGVSATVGYGSTGASISPSLSGGPATSVSIVSGPSHGSASVSGLGFLYTPATGYSGDDSFSYSATGPGGASGVATVSITVPQPQPPVVDFPTGPVVVPPTTPGPGGGSSTIVELGPRIPGVIDGFRVSGAVPHGSIQIIETAASAPAIDAKVVGPLHAGGGFQLVYTPAANFMGTETITLVAFGPGGESRPISFTFQVTGKAPDLSGQTTSSAQITFTPTSGLVGGPFQSLRITRAPAFGAAVVRDATIIFTPGLADSGATSLDYVVDLPFGSSAPGRIDLVSNLVPAAQALTARTVQGRPVTSRISDAAGGPFTAAAVVSVAPTSAGTATISGSSGAYDLTFTPSGAFTGEAVVTFSLTNAFGTTNGRLTVMVEARPDPGLDPEVRGLATGQVTAARRFVDAQVGNFQRRLQDIRDGANASSQDLHLNLGFGADDDMRDSRMSLRRQLGVPTSLTGPDALDQDRDRELMTMALWADRLRAGDGASDATAPRLTTLSTDGSQAGDTHVGLWTAGMIDWGRQDATGQRDTRFTTHGVSGGLDVRINDRLIVGGGLGYGEDRTKIGDSGSITNGQAVSSALYASWRPMQSLYLDGVFGSANLNFDTRRWVRGTRDSAPGYAQGRRSGDVRFASVSVGRIIRSGGLSGDLYGRLDARRISLDAFSETAGGLSDLKWDALDQDSLSANLGATLRWTLQTRRHGLFMPDIRLEWSHELEDIGLQGVRYADWAASPTYLIPLDAWSRDALNLNLGMEWSLSDRLAFSFGYRAMVGDSSSSQGGQIGIKYGW